MFSNVSAFGVHTENGSFSKRTVFKFKRFHWPFRTAPFVQRSNVNARQNGEVLFRFHMKKEQCERGLRFIDFVSH